MASIILEHLFDQTMKVSLKIAMSAPRFHNLESGGLQSRLRWWIRSPAGKGKGENGKPLLAKKHTPMFLCSNPLSCYLQYYWFVL